jgi:hypothetical protein
MKKLTISLTILLIVIISGYPMYRHYNLTPKNLSTSCDNSPVTDSYSIAENIEKNTKNYAFTTKDIFGQSTEGGEQTNYTLDGKIVFIKQIFFGETGKSEVSYYFKNNNIFYVKKVNTEYLLQISEDSSAKVKTIEIKDFFINSNKELCSWYKNKEVQINDSDTRDLLNYLISGIQF